VVRIVVVDDERAIADGVAAYLRHEGHEVELAATPARAIDLGRAGPDLIILDLMLAGGSGFDVLRTLRGEGRRVPVIILSARVHLVDRVTGLELGADDYMTKPFEPRELVARVGAVLRRTMPASRPGDTPGCLRLVDLEVDEAAREVRRGSEVVVLTRTEFDLLVTLAASPGRVLTRETLGVRVFGGLYEECDRTIDSHIRSLRRKLGPGPDGSEYIETVRGVGYRATGRVISP
jgi:two-component system OmpR family response regulator